MTRIEILTTDARSHRATAHLVPKDATGDWAMVERRAANNRFITVAMITTRPRPEADAHPFSRPAVVVIDPIAQPTRGDLDVSIHSDIPTQAQIELLLNHRAPSSVSIYLPTSRVTREARGDRTALSNLGSDALEQLRAGDADPAAVTYIEQAIEDLVGDDDFWAEQVDSLAVFVAPDHVYTYRLPNQLTAAVEVSDRFHVKPLFRALTFPQAAYILALAKGAVRFLEIGPEAPPRELTVADMPRDAWDPRSNRVFKARERTYVRRIDQALRGVITGSGLPLILAATETVDALYRTVNSYPHLAERRWPGNPEEATDAELASNARAILDELYAAELAATAELFDVRSSQGRGATDVADVARFATAGAVDTVLVDIDTSVAGSIDEESGAVHFADEADATSYGVIDEIVRRVYLAGGRVMAVRRADVPGGGPVAAILRYAVQVA